ncbi:glutaredoxin family protein [Propionibacteriaceae bacterium Y2011]|uniref:glutaredoxin family protein n=1 Tax=Microlunatus sp. Y2014 TaxID=3418488 RepID=UPI003B4D3972
MAPAPADGRTPTTPRVRVLVRQGCHLCEVALATVREVCAETGDEVEVVDIDPDPALREQYTDQVPVTLVDGRQHDFWRVDAQRLRVALAGRPR